MEDQRISLLEPKRPSIHLRDVVLSYMLSKKSHLDGTIHPALNTHERGIQFDEKKDKWTLVKEEEEPSLEPVYLELEQEEQSFLDKMNSYDTKAGPKFRVGINVLKKHSVDEVLEAIEEAKMQYDEKERKGLFALLRKAFRKLGKNRDACNAWLELLPGNSHYLSVVCGGIKMIIGAAGRLGEINEQIVDVLAKIPEVLDGSERMLVINKASHRLRKFVVKLYRSILEAMGNVLNFYEQRAIQRATRALFKQCSYQRPLEENIKAISNYRDAVDREADICGMELNKETNQIVKKTEIIAEGIDEKTRIVLKQTNNILGGTERVYLQTSSMTRRTEDLQNTVEKLSLDVGQSYEKYEQSNKKVLQALENLKEDFLHRNPIPETSRLPLQKSADMRSYEKARARKKLLSALSYDKDSPRKDMHTNLEQAMRMPLQDQDIAVHVMQSDHLQYWLRTTSSTNLIISIDPNISKGERSPLSFVCAKMASSLRHIMKSETLSTGCMFLDLHFFCGEHIDWRDNIDNGPAGVISSLLAQLLTRYKDFDLSLIKHLKTLRSDDTEALCKVFTSLVKQLPEEAIVFCILDDISVYDDYERSEECIKLARKLIKMSRRSRREDGCVFKLLMTIFDNFQPNLSDDIDEEREILYVPEAVERGGGFTDMKWTTSVGHEITQQATRRLIRNDHLKR